MPENNGNNSNTELIERMARIETKVDFIIQDLPYIRERLESTEKLANHASAKSDENARDIAEMKSTSKWLWGIVLATLGSLIVSLIVYFVAK